MSLFLEVCGRASLSLSCHVVMWLPSTCSWQSDSCRCNLGCSECLPLCQIFFSCLVCLKMLPRNLFNNWVNSFGNTLFLLLKISPCSPICFPGCSFLCALVSSVSCLSCSPCSSSLNPFVSFHRQETVKWSWQSLSAQPCHEAYGTLHLGVFGVRGVVFFCLKSGVWHISDIKRVPGQMMCHLRNSYFGVFLVIFSSLLSALWHITAF